MPTGSSSTVNFCKHKSAVILGVLMLHDAAAGTVSQSGYFKIWAKLLNGAVHQVQDKAISLSYTCLRRIHLWTA